MLRLGGQYTHLFGGQFEVNVSAAVAYGFNATQQRAMEYRRLRPDRPLPDRQFGLVRMGRRVGYRFSQRMVIDAFLIGTLGGQIGTTIHGGIGLRYLF